jgi:hypothetical protein
MKVGMAGTRLLMVVRAMDEANDGGSKEKALCINNRKSGYEVTVVVAAIRKLQICDWKMV